MTTISLVTSVFLSKAEALAVLAEALDAPWNTDDPGNITLLIGQGGVLTIEVPKFGEDLPLTLDLYHPQEEELRRLADWVAITVSDSLGWTTNEIPQGASGGVP